MATGLGSGGDAQGDHLARIENLTGSQFADVLTGNSGNNVFQGEGGADVIYGGGGNDRHATPISAVAVTVNLVTGHGSGGDARAMRCTTSRT